MLVIFSLAQSAWAATPQIRAGASHTVMLHSDGTIWTTGSNSAGQLGDGTGTNLRKSPVQVGLSANATNWTMVATGADHTLALKADGSLWAWGSNQFGQLGDGSGINKSSPVRIGSGNNWTAVAAGGSSSFALKADGTLWAWGNNAKGQLGDGSVIARSAPVPVLNMSSNGSRYVAISTGAEHTLALQADGTLWTWGSNQYGNVSPILDQNDQFTITYRPADMAAHSTPAQIDADNDWALIAAGGSHSLAIKADGTLWAWGRNNTGQLGIGVTDGTPHLVPVQVETDNDWVALSGGDLHTLAVKRSGTLWAWGENNNGELGDGTTTDQNKPIQISVLSDGSNITDIVAVAAGATHSLALKANGEIYAWGINLAGQLGDNTLVGSLDPFPVAQDAISWVGTEPGGQFTTARRSDGTLWSWGDNSSGQLGDNSLTQRTSPVMVGTGTNWIAEATGWSHTVALKADGTLWAWGDNTSGQLGDNSTNDRSAPNQITVTQPATVSNNWAAVAAGDFHTLALKADGTLWSWGDNASGQLGDGTTTMKSVPIQIDPAFGNHWIAIAAGGSHSMALQSDGTLWTWGDNSYGQLGDPTLGSGLTPPFVSTPQQIFNFSPPTTGYNSSWVAIAAGLDHSLALQADGTLWAWGGNFSGQLGNGNAIDQNVPTQVNSSTGPVVHFVDVVAISAGDSYSVARKADGSLWSWGNNMSGQLGNGSIDATPATHSTPLRESTNSNDWFSAGSGGSHTIALKAGGTLSAWGSNAFGQLGDGTTVAKSSPSPLTEARIDVSPDTMDYNIVAIGSESIQNITIENKGTASLTVSALNFGGPDSAMFSVKTGGTCSTAPITIAPAGSCTVAVAFSAELPGGAKAATLTITSNDPHYSLVNVDVSGMAGVQHTLTTSVYAGSPAGSGTITPSGAVLVLDGTSKTFILTPNVGYHVADVTVDGVSQGAVTSVTLPFVKASARVEANFAINVYTVTTTTVNGTIAGATKVNHGSTAIYAITPAIGYHIADVMVDGVSQGAVTTLTLPAITANRVITALFVAAAPTLSLNPVTTPTNKKSQTLSGTVEAGATVTIAMGTTSLPATVSGTTWSSVIPALAEGANTITVSATGAAGNTTTLPPATITLDTIPPVTTATPAPGNYTDSVAVTLATEAGSTVYYTTDGTPATTASPVYSAPIRLAATTTTPFTVQFMAVDQAGNAEPVKNAAYLIHLGCDLNGDGKVDVRDALKALQISVGMFSATPYEMMRGDVGPLVNGKPNPNGIIDLADALVILQRSVGLVSPW